MSCWTTGVELLSTELRDSYAPHHAIAPSIRCITPLVRVYEEFVASLYRLLRSTTRTQLMNNKGCNDCVMRTSFDAHTLNTIGQSLVRQSAVAYQARTLLCTQSETVRTCVDLCCWAECTLVDQNSRLRVWSGGELTAQLAYSFSNPERVIPHQVNPRIALHLHGYHHTHPL